MQRRDFIAGIGTMAWPLATAAQSDRTYRIALFSPSTFDSVKVLWLNPFFDELRRNGLSEGRNLVVDTEGMGITSFETAAAEAVKANPDAMITWGPAPAHAAQQATKTIPIVVYINDPVESGLVASMRRPGGNTTGIGIFVSQLDVKRFETLHEIVPAARRIGILADPQELGLDSVESFARGLGLELAVQEARRTEEIVPAIDTLAAAHVDAIDILASAVFYAARGLIIDRVQALRLPAIYFWADMAREGGLVGLGPNVEETQRLLAQQLLRVLHGEPPGEVPILQPRKFDLFINLKTARALGLTIPQSVLLRADEIIE
jgi:putative ABC transport system substrate-binding protein